LEIKYFFLFVSTSGTGKTSLCKALAQKMAIRLSDRYDCGQVTILIDF
jgi:guanylate kinase